MRKITFAEAASKYSNDESTAAKSGEMAMFSRGEVVPALEQAIFPTKPGTLTPIVETEYGFHLMNVIELRHKGKGRSIVRQADHLSKWVECVNGIAGDNFPCRAADRA